MNFINIGNLVTERSKYRLRRYDKEKENIKFECKSSFFNLKRKRFVWLSQREAEIMPLDQNCKTFSDIPLINEFYCLKKKRTDKTENHY